MPWNNKSNDHAQQEEEQGYLVSLGDMLSGLIFLFIITLIVFAIRLHKETVEQKIQRDQLEKTNQELIDATKVRKNLLEEIKKQLDNQGVQVTIDEKKGLLRLPEEILFKSGTADFVAGGLEKLNILANVLGDLLPCYSGTRNATINDLGRCPNQAKPGRLDAVLVEGHTDNMPLNNAGRNNWDLSADRSIKTLRSLYAERPKLSYLLNADGLPLFGVSGYADTRPEIFHVTKTAEPLNRRIAMRFILAQPPVEQTDANPSGTTGEFEKEYTERSESMNATTAQEGQ